MTGAQSPSLTEFLSVRLDEDEALAPDTHREGCPWMTDQLDDCDCGVPARVLADVEAKRAVVALHSGDEDPSDCPPWGRPPDGSESCSTLLALAQPYRDHPDFDEGWRP